MAMAVVLIQITGSWAYEWTTADGQILRRKNDTSVWETTMVSGASWFGFETQDFVINGLWANPMDVYLDQLVEIGINVIRVPFSSEWVLFNWDLYPDNTFVSADPSLAGLKSLQILDLLFKKASARGIGIMLDLHRLHKEYISELWYSPTDNIYTTETFFTTWFTMLDHVLKQHRNLVAVDLLNEPHGQATWGSGDYSTDWRLFVERVIPVLVDRYPKETFLFFVEGIEWGHTFHDWNDRNAPLTLQNKSVMHRVVFSPHTYGRSVVSSTPDNPLILRQNWHTDFGFLRDLGFVVAVGEWGGMTSIDSEWMTHLVHYLTDKNMTNQFFWSLGPNSGDVQGILLDDWKTVDSFKKNMIHSLVPVPTRFHFE